MNYGKFTFIEHDDFIDLNRVYRISLKIEKSFLFWAFYSIDNSKEYVKSIHFGTRREAHEWLRDKLNENRKIDGQEKKKTQ